jgi:hypothetical protein
LILLVAEKVRKNMLRVLCKYRWFIVFFSARAVAGIGL